MRLADTLQATRLSRESNAGWARESQYDFSVNQNSLELNEHGPALKVFWSRLWRDGCQADERACLPNGARVVKRNCLRNSGRKEQERVNPAHSFRFESWGSGVIGQKSARTRWLTERIA
jgi:hypothetical protein